MKKTTVALVVVAAICSTGIAGAAPSIGKSGRASTDAVQFNSPPPPVANFSYITKNLTATFTDSSNDVGGTIVAHAWTFGDGGTSTATSPSHTYAAFGTYTATEKVTDNTGLVSSKTASVLIVTSEPQFLFSNTGFETTGSWKSSAGVLCTAGCSGQVAHAGVGFAWLGGYGTTHTDSIAQQSNSVLLPGSAQLQFYLHIDTAETSTTKSYDRLNVAVYNKSGALLKTLATFSNLNRAIGYQLHSYDLSAYVGQQVTVKFTASEDASEQTSFVLDDVTLIDY